MEEVIPTATALILADMPEVNAVNDLKIPGIAMRLAHYMFLQGVREIARGYLLPKSRDCLP